MDLLFFLLFAVVVILIVVYVITKKLGFTSVTAKITRNGIEYIGRKEKKSDN
jgi:hypothetical protein